MVFFLRFMKEITMAKSHILGYPRIGNDREMKKAVEAYWRGEISQDQLQAVGKAIRFANWKTQAEAGLDFVSVGDFSWYDHILDMSLLFGIIPERFAAPKLGLDTFFSMARGKSPNGVETEACEMTKWFNTNYHYIVPEFAEDQAFQITDDTLLRHIEEAQALNYAVKPVLIGPLTLLWLGKIKYKDKESISTQTSDGIVDRAKLTLLDTLIPAYNELFYRINERHIEWLQIDEPILALDLPTEWQEAFSTTYAKLDFKQLKCLLTTYFATIDDNLSVVAKLPVHGLHIDVTSYAQLLDVFSQLPEDKILSLGLINGRNIWRADLVEILANLKQIKPAWRERLWVGSSCSLLHVPVDLDKETKLDNELKSWLAFAKQKLTEIVLLTRALNASDQMIAEQLAENQTILESRRLSPRIHDALLKTKIASLTKEYARRKSSYAVRAKKQRERLQLPLLPSTTIGSFPQTQAIRIRRQDYKLGKIGYSHYVEKIKDEIAEVVARQEALDLDVLVHGEAERNDMVEYFGELLNGFAFTQHGWVQSYGSRCVKPPIIYGDVSRIAPMTVDWIRYAQSLTTRPMKGMLTGPITILAWSFERDDQALERTALQIALALREEVVDLEKAGIKIIQIDEPAFREALPLRKKEWSSYFNWAVHCFRIASCGVEDDTQIHTHMCYSEFNDIIDAIAHLDADVITIECSRSQMELLTAFEKFAYPNEIGPGVYDIHSPRVPTTQEMVAQLEKALHSLPITRLWVNPDCGLKTRHWAETEAALKNMVNAAKILRAQYARGEKWQ
jgi:5-methyltetrahydropteroyltriglutamate--homocysteine methyltransferase